MMKHGCVVVGACALLGASCAHGAVVVYQFNGTVTTNTMASGGFAGLGTGVPASLQIAIETSTTPGFAAAGRNHWDGVAGTVLGMQATVDGYTSVATANSTPTRARVVDDAINSSVYIDQFWLEVPAVAPAPDFTVGSAIFSSTGAAPPISSSLSGIDWPTSSAELDPFSFTTERYILLRGATGGQFLRADITSIVVVPGPGGIAVGAVGGLGLIRRRRAGV